MTATLVGDRVRYLDRLPANLSGLSGAVLLIHDEKLDRIPLFRKWARSLDLRYPVSAGEALKDITAFPGHIEGILSLIAGAARSQTTIVAAGGGSVGDFAGFVASVLKRGVALIHVPTTWLAALDSAHGGKTALNVGGYKNQIGTFHFPDAVWIVRPFLEALPAEDTRAASGELLKMAMLLGGDLFRRVAASTELGPEELWKLLPAAVEGKTKIVEADPREENGYRRVLNLGHTLGHALESQCGLAHGVAVGCGLRFSVEWSRSLGYLDEEEARTLSGLLARYPEYDPEALPGTLGRSRLEALLGHDKKSASSGRIHFVFLQAIGKPMIGEVSIAEVVTEAERQGWIS